MPRNLIRWLLTGLVGLLTACAIITVNVYFPEKDVKQAYKSLDEMLLKQGGGETKEPVPAEQKDEVKPQSRLRLPVSLELVSEAHAAEKVADELAVELSSMPEVLKAYDEIRARLPELNTLRESGIVGETNQGLVAIRDKARGAGKEELVKAINDNRKVVITGMAKAILKVNKQPFSEAGLKQVLPKAAATFATIRQEGAKPGWWIQLPNGRWVQK
jgi:uncharacterized protein YdbL (DUF1318 family)